MLMAELPIAVLMKLRPAPKRWSQPGWGPVAVRVDRADLDGAQLLRQIDADTCVLSGMSLQLYPDENDGYFENWIVPEPKVPMCGGSSRTAWYHGQNLVTLLC